MAVLKFVSSIQNLPSGIIATNVAGNLILLPNLKLKCTELSGVIGGLSCRKFSG